MKNCTLSSGHYSFLDVRLEQCDQADCSSGYSFGPYIRDFYLLHFVTNGTGTFHISNQSYTLKAGDLFFIPPGILTFYQADTDTPWSYTWIGMRGTILPKVFNDAGLSKKNPILKYSDRLLDALNNVYLHSNTDGFDSLSTAGCLYLFLDELTKCGTSTGNVLTVQQTYIDAAVKYIDQNIYNSISVSALSDMLGIDRSYFCSIFKMSMGVSPQQYIINLKMQKAKLFLETTNVDIKYIADSLGYKDLYAFSHTFKRIHGISPKEWRTQKKNLF